MNEIKALEILPISSEHLMLFPINQVQFPIPTSGSLQLPVTPAQGEMLSSAVSYLLYTALETV